MKKSWLSIALLALTMSTAGFAADFVSNEIIVKYRSSIRRDRVTMNAFYDSMGVDSVYRFEGLMPNFEKLKLAPNARLVDVLARIQTDPLVEYAQPNYILKIQPVALPKSKLRPCTTIFSCLSSSSGGGWGGGAPSPGPGPNPTRPDVQPAPPVGAPAADPRLGELYGMEKIGALEAWKTFRGSSRTIVAVIDTGVDYNHEDLSNNMWRNGKNEHGDIVGYDFVHNDALPFDDHMHGTHTSGTVGAYGENGKGVSGVAPSVSIMGLKFLSAEGSGTTSDAIRAIDFAIKNGAKILSNSWGGPGDEENTALFDAIERARKSDVLFVAAAGNESADNDGSRASYPAAFNNENLISVAATDNTDKLAYFSNYGKKTVHLAAPGVKIMSTVPGNEYGAASGTSMACPHVAGAAALVWARHPNYTYKQVKDALLSTVDPIAGLAGKTITGGRLNVFKAMQ